MISRRSFLSALAALPFVGKMIPRDSKSGRALQAIAARPNLSLDELTQYTERLIADMRLQMVQKQWEIHANAKAQAMRPRLTFAEWDQRYQA